MGTTSLKFFRAIKHILVFLEASGSNQVKFYAVTVLPFDYRPSLTCSQKFLSLLRNIGGRAFALLFFLDDGWGVR